MWAFTSFSHTHACWTQRGGSIWLDKELEGISAMWALNAWRTNYSNMARRSSCGSTICSACWFCSYIYTHFWIVQTWWDFVERESCRDHVSLEHIVEDQRNSHHVSFQWKYYILWTWAYPVRLGSPRVRLWISHFSYGQRLKLHIWNSNVFFQNVSHTHKWSMLSFLLRCLYVRKYM